MRPKYDKGGNTTRGHFDSTRSSQRNSMRISKPSIGGKIYFHLCFLQNLQDSESEFYFVDGDQLASGSRLHGIGSKAERLARGRAMMIESLSMINEKQSGTGSTYLTWKEVMQDSILVDHNWKFAINFNVKLFDIIGEVGTRNASMFAFCFADSPVPIYSHTFRQYFWKI